MTMQLDHDELHRLLATLADSDIQEFFLEGEDFRLEIKRNLIPSITQAPSQTAVNASNETIQVQPELRADSPSISNSPSDPPPPVAGSRSDLIDVTAPMVGTFYRAPSPDDPPFVEVGTRIGVG